MDTNRRQEETYQHCSGPSHQQNQNSYQQKINRNIPFSRHRIVLVGTQSFTLPHLPFAPVLFPSTDNRRKLVSIIVRHPSWRERKSRSSKCATLLNVFRACASRLEIIGHWLFRNISSDQSSSAIVRSTSHVAYFAQWTAYLNCRFPLSFPYYKIVSLSHLDKPALWSVKGKLKPGFSDTNRGGGRKKSEFLKIFQHYKLEAR